MAHGEILSSVVMKSRAYADFPRLPAMLVSYFKVLVLNQDLPGLRGQSGFASFSTSRR
jgi:hypothetical protein